ncbi:hypothetical protein [Aeromicrobium sp. Sec7.5]|uniref:hypothetical protein n=1 Tax=Aeromicrobium sp. Sec7.5 TaxID=3121276 RepID=UPI002FE474E1
MDIILERRDGIITTEEMMKLLRDYHYTSFMPAADDWDPLAMIAMPRGTIEDLGEAFDENLLAEDEYDTLATDPSLKVTRTQMPSIRELD